MPHTEQIEVTTWGCVRCMRVDRTSRSANPPTTNPPHFTNRGTLKVTTVGRDFQGGIVGPGAIGLDGDLCDDCLDAFIGWVNVPVPTDSLTEVVDPSTDAEITPQ